MKTIGWLPQQSNKAVSLPPSRQQCPVRGPVVRRVGGLAGEQEHGSRAAAHGLREHVDVGEAGAYGGVGVGAAGQRVRTPLRPASQQGCQP